MDIQRTIEVLSYVCLLMCSLGFVWNSFEDYVSGFTSYTTAEEPITESDLPTLTICVKFPKNLERYSYGVNLNITARIIENKESNVTLIMDQKIKASPTLQIHLSEMILGWGQQNGHGLLGSGLGYQWQCYKISNKGTGIELAIHRLKMQLLFQTPLGLPMFHSMHVFVTSEDNSYGLTGYQWYDGYVELSSIGGVSSVNSGIEIVKVTEYQNMPSQCSLKSRKSVWT